MTEKECKRRKEKAEFSKWAKENPNENEGAILIGFLVLPFLIFLAVVALPFLIPIILICALCGISLSFFPFPPI